jgi:hypothetical protein
MSEGTRLDEASLRRDPFPEATVSVVLADGQSWHLAKPRMRFVPHDGPTGFRVCLVTGAYDDYQSLMDDLEEANATSAEAAAADRGRVIITAELALARSLLGQCYDLTTQQMGRLLQFSYGDPEEDPEGCRIRDEVMDVAMGRGVKAEAAGGA